MTTEQQVFLQPQDVLFLRGNKLFGDAGSYGESLIPPWPSVAAGALRSRMMADDPGLEPPALQDPACFTLTAFNLARRDASGKVEALHALPADLLVQGEGKTPGLRALRPTMLASGIASSAKLAQLPVLAEGMTRQKASGGWWLGSLGWQQYLDGQLPDAAHLVSSKELWKLDTRVGVGLSSETRRADDGKLFTVQAVALGKSCDTDRKVDVGFLAAARGLQLPQSGLVRLGGDGRAATIHTIAPADRARPALPPQTRRFKLVLTTPGLFDAGWRLPGLDDDKVWHGPNGSTARLVCAAVPRAETISGWDLAKPGPKPARRAAPTGSVYWLDDFTGDVAALGTLIESGLWCFAGQTDDIQRRAEGFNRCAIGAWS